MMIRRCVVSPGSPCAPPGPRIDWRRSNLAQSYRARSWRRLPAESGAATRSCGYKSSARPIYIYREIRGSSVVALAQCGHQFKSLAKRKVDDSFACLFRAIEPNILKFSILLAPLSPERAPFCARNGRPAGGESAPPSQPR